MQESLVRTEPLSKIGQRSILIFTPQQPGRATCTARNSKGKDSNAAYVYFGEMNKKLDIVGVGEDPIAEGDNVVVECGASVYKFSGDLYWTHNGLAVKEDNGNTP